jgi:hypothetical protein
MEKKFNELTEGETFRFATDPVDRVRTACQVGKVEIYCPHQHSPQYDEGEVYLKSEKIVIIIHK